MPKEDKQIKLFDSPEWWEEHWEGMPEFVQNDNMPFKTLYVHFRNQKDVKKFSELINQKITSKTQSVWYPAEKIGGYFHKRWSGDES